MFCGVPISVLHLVEIQLVYREIFDSFSFQSSETSKLSYCQEMMLSHRTEINCEQGYKITFESVGSL